MSRSGFATMMKHLNLELFVWVSGLTYLALTDPGSGSHFSFCILERLGISWCPGCGLGRSISYIFHGDLSSSVVTHTHHPAPPPSAYSAFSSTMYSAHFAPEGSDNRSQGNHASRVRHPWSPMPKRR